MAQIEKVPEPFPNQPIETPADENLRLRVETAYVSSSPQSSPTRLLPGRATDSRSTGLSSGKYWKESVREAFCALAELTGEAVNTARCQSARALSNIQEMLHRGRVNSARYSETAGRRAEHYAHEEPVGVIAAAAAGAFLLGIVLRIWRSSRYE